MWREAEAYRRRRPPRHCRHRDHKHYGKQCEGLPTSAAVALKGDDSLKVPERT